MTLVPPFFIILAEFPISSRTLYTAIKSEKHASRPSSLRIPRSTPLVFLVSLPSLSPDLFPPRPSERLRSPPSLRTSRSRDLCSRAVSPTRDLRAPPRSRLIASRFLTRLSMGFPSCHAHLCNRCLFRDFFPSRMRVSRSGTPKASYITIFMHL